MHSNDHRGDRVGAQHAPLPSRHEDHHAPAVTPKLPEPPPRHEDHHPVAAKPEPPPPADPPKPKLIEVELLKKYCPHWLVQEDGSCLRNEGDHLAVLMPGVMKLHLDDAEHTLEAGVAKHTRHTLRDM